MAAIPAFQELARASRSAEKLFDTLQREFPPTLETIRLTGLELSELSDNIDEGIKSASSAVKQVDQGLMETKKQAQNIQVTTRSFFTGFKAAWKNWNKKPKRYLVSESFELEGEEENR
jgi:hypothetical protein